jgi:periplasmic divalent cation tolerance protein
MVAIVYSTIDNIQDARRIAHTLVEEQIVACVNIIPKIESVYRWKGKIENDEEVVLIAKTTDKNVKKTIQRIKSLHSYELPDIIVIPIIGGLKDYLDYINDETS